MVISVWGGILSQCWLASLLYLRAAQPIDSLPNQLHHCYYLCPVWTLSIITNDNM
jgi:hypothetical protein